MYKSHLSSSLNQVKSTVQLVLESKHNLDALIKIKVTTCSGDVDGDQDVSWRIAVNFWPKAQLRFFSSWLN